MSVFSETPEVAHTASTLKPESLTPPSVKEVRDNFNERAHAKSTLKGQGTAAHEDINLLTVLPASDQAGLELLGTNGKWVTMGIPSDGSYGIPEKTQFGFPVTCANGKFEIVKGLEIDAFSQERINITLNELMEEREGVKHLLGK